MKTSILTYVILSWLPISLWKYGSSRLFSEQHRQALPEGMEDYRKNRNAEAEREEKSQIAQQKLEIYKEKNKPEPTVASLIQDMLNQKAEKDRLAQEMNQPTK